MKVKYFLLHNQNMANFVKKCFKEKMSLIKYLERFYKLKIIFFCSTIELSSFKKLFFTLFITF